MVTRRQIRNLENKIKVEEVEDNGVYDDYDYSKLSDKELRKLELIGLKAEREGITSAEEAEAEEILRSVYIGNKD